MRLVVTFLVLAALLWAVPARADDAPPSHFQTRPFALYAQLGLGTPLGLAGLEAEATLTRNLALAAGLGAGFAGPQVALMPRLRLNLNPGAAFVFGVGFSFGRYQSVDFCLNECPFTNDPKGNVGWANFEGGYEIRFAGGFSMRCFAGYGLVVLDHQKCAPGPHGCGKKDSSLIFFGTGLGWAF